jgi:CO/xanthine dehydrogenase FAD-binding subunit
MLDVTRIDGFRGISVERNGTRIGAATTWTDISRAALPPAFDGLKAAARDVGGVQIQNAGTVAGNLCNASPAADGVPPLLTLDAAIELVSAARGRRVVPLQDFVKGVRQTAKAPDELVTAVLIPPLSGTERARFEKLGARRYLVISITMTAVLIDCGTDGLIRKARVAVGACGPVAERLPALEKELEGQHPQEVIITPEHMSVLSPIDDARGSARYRLQAAAEQCQRAIQHVGRS